MTATEPSFELTTIPQAFAQLAGRFPAKTAVWYLGSAFSYARLDELSSRFASGLLTQGVEPGQAVMLYLPNSVQWLIAWLGVMKAGCVAVPITPIYTPSDVEYIANDTGAVAIVCSDRNFGYVTRVMKNTPIRAVVISGMADMLPWHKRLFGWAFDLVPKGKITQGQDSQSLSALLKQNSPFHPDLPQEPDALCEIIYTGGTTKHPKGVPITHRLLLNCAHEQISYSAVHFKPEDNVIMGSAPLFHILGQTTALGTILVHGGSIILQPRVNLDAMMDAISRYRATTFIGVPALFRMILDHDRLDLYDMSSLSYCFSGGDVMPLELAQRWTDRIGRTVYIGYGSSETVGGISMSPVDRENPPQTMGLVLPSKSTKIINPGTLQEVPVGEPGEMVVHSNPMVEAYWNKPQETAEAFIELEGKTFYRTGDVVRADENGYLFFVDRTVDTIKHKGYRVSASEIECVLQEHHAVVASCVVGVPDKKVGERVKAFVVLKKDVRGITGYDLISFCRQRLSAYKVPQYIEFRDMLPKSKVGKLLRREVRSEERSRLEG